MDAQRGDKWTCSTGLKQHLKYHMVTHGQDEEVKCETARDRPSCDTCHRVFSTFPNLRRHIDTVHSTIERPRFPCGTPGCEKTYLRKNALSRHIRADHSENPTRFRCTLCGKECKTRQHLEKHISTHTTEKPHICSTCGRSFSTTDGRKSHEDIHLEKATRRIFQCELCPQTFLRRVDLQKHVQFVHENRRNFACTFCHKRFSTSNVMRRHVEARHPANAEKIHSCDKCEFRTHSKGNLANHARRHNPANRRECYFCQKQFFYSSALVKHCRLHTLEW